MPRPDLAHCTSPKCAAPIIFVRVANEAGHKLRLMPLNAEPDPGGNVAVMADGTGTWRGRVLGRSKPLEHETVYCPHFATCTDPGEHRRRQRGNWTSAVSARNADQRRGRSRGHGTSPAIGPGMTRLYPGGLPGTMPGGKETP